MTRTMMSLVVCLLAHGCSERTSAPTQPSTGEHEGPTLVDPGEAPPAAPALDSPRVRFERELAAAYPTSTPIAETTREFDLRAAPATVPLFDGRPFEVWAYDGRVPGPVLRVRLGEEIVVRFRNDLPQPTTIHWHGMRVPNAMDGVPGLTQEPIAPGATFTYRFTPRDAGTFWFHPHVRGAEQVERGLYGVLIVDDRESLPYSRDEVWILDDWRLAPDGGLDPNFVTRHDLAHDGRWGQVITVNGDASARMVARPGERIRVRLVNTSNGRVYRPDFGALSPRVIAVDGMYTGHPLDVSTFELAPGNRLDLDLVIPRDAGDRSFDVVDRFTRQAHTLMRVEVRGEAVPTPDFAAPSNPRFPTWQGAFEMPVDVTYVLNAQRGGPHGIQWTINGRAWEHVGDRHEGGHDVTELTGGRWVRVRFQNDSARLHPMHIHGQFFRVIARDGRAAAEPYFRDTVLVHPRETVDVAMVPIDWGRWMMHCHILEHAEAGMMTEVHVVAPDGEERAF